LAWRCSQAQLRCFGGDGTLRENPAGDVLASLTTKVWNAAPKSWTGAAAMADASLNRRMTVQFADAVAFDDGSPVLERCGATWAAGRTGAAFSTLPSSSRSRRSTSRSRS
jgi:hypothetical protein